MTSFANRMSRPRRRGLTVLVSVVALAGVLVGGLVAFDSEDASAHGSQQQPPSRTYTCRFLTPDSPMCADAWAQNPQALYDWMEVNIGDVGGQHQARIPDGELCSAGRDKYAAFDTPSDTWPVTPLVASADGTYPLTFYITAPHATSYFRYYLTQPGFDPNQPLRWSDLELVHDSGAQPAQSYYEADVALPAREGQHILYTVWQRSDSLEAFYACSDVTLDGTGTTTTTGGPTTTTTPTDSSTTTTTTTTPAPSSGLPVVTSPRATIEPAVIITSDWESGYCAVVTVDNTGSSWAEWEVYMTNVGTLTSTWDSTVTTGDPITVRGAAWNLLVDAGQSTSFGFCAERSGTEPPTTTTSTTAPSAGTVDVMLTTTTDWGSGYCAEGIVHNGGDETATWTATVDIDADDVTALWNGHYEAVGDGTRVRGASWNRQLAPDASTSFGFCATH